MSKWIVYGTFEVEVEADSEEEAMMSYDIEDADLCETGAYEEDGDDY